MFGELGIRVPKLQTCFSQFYGEILYHLRSEDQKVTGIRLARQLLVLTYPSVLKLLFRGRHLRVWVHVPANMTTVAGFLRNIRMCRKTLEFDRENFSLKGTYSPYVCI